MRLALLMVGAMAFHKRAGHTNGKLTPAALTLAAAAAFVLLSL